MARKSTFKSGSGVITCATCGSKTRDTGHMEDQFDKCRFCIEKDMQYNNFSDGMITEDEYKMVIAEIEQQRREWFGKQLKKL